MSIIKGGAARGPGGGRDQTLRSGTVVKHAPIFDDGPPRRAAWNQPLSPQFVERMDKAAEEKSCRSSKSAANTP